MHGPGPWMVLRFRVQDGLRFLFWGVKGHGLRMVYGFGFEVESLSRSSGAAGSVGLPPLTLMEASNLGFPLYLQRSITLPGKDSKTIPTQAL